MRIAVLSNLFPPRVLGGAELAAHAVAKRLAQDGHEIEVLTLGDSDGEEELDGMRIHRLGSRPFYSPYHAKSKPGWMKPLWHGVDLHNPFMAAKVRHLLQAMKPDLVHSHNIVGFSTAAWKSASGLGLPVVFHLHDYHLVCPRATLMDAALKSCPADHRACNLRSAHHRKALLGHVRHIISPSRFCVETLAGRLPGGLGSMPISIIPNGTEYAEAPRPPMDWHAPKLNILFVGGLFEHKGVGVLLDVIAKLQAHSQAFEFHIAGKGPLEAQVRAVADSHPHVHFHGFVSGQAKLDLFLKCHIFFSPSIWLENNPVTILEALSLGVPVLGSDIGGIPELLRPVGADLLFSPGSAQAAAEGLLAFFGEKRGSLSSISTSLLARRDQYGMRKQVDSILSVFQGIRQAAGDIA